MDITSPFFVVPVFVAVFACCILWATGAHGESQSPTEDITSHKAS